MKNTTFIAKITRIMPLCAAVIIPGGCGTRAGNPKKPNTTSQIVKLPTVDADIPSDGLDGDLTASLSLTQQNSSNAATLASSVPRGQTAVTSLNLLIQKLNEGELHLDETYTITVEGKKVTALASNASKAGYQHDAVICVEDAPFLTLSWSEDLSIIDAIRNVDLTPYTEVKAKHIGQGGSMMHELQWRKNDPVQISFWQTRIPEKNSSLLKQPERTIDAYRMRIKDNGVAEFTGVSDWQYAGDDSKDLIADLRTAGQMRPDQKHFYLGHIEGVNIICPDEFDEDSQENPAWCIGLKRRNTARADYAFMGKSEIGSAWNLMSDMEITKEAALKEVGFPQGTQCPK